MILLLGGTADARAIAHTLTGAGHHVLLTAVSDYAGALAIADAAEIRTGALTREELSTLVTSATAIIDATHPFAAAISQMAIEVCGELAIPYLRFERPRSDYDDKVIAAATAHEAAHKAVEIANGGTVFLTVGSKTLAEYLPVVRETGCKVVARVLPTLKVIAECDSLGLTPREIIALQGPITTDVELALLRHYHAGVLVTKDSGTTGGVEEKLSAAALAGIPAIVVGRPAIDYPSCVSTIDEVQVWLEELVVCMSSPGLFHIYTGDGKGKTTAAVGLAVRARGAGLRVCFIQFVKGGVPSSELAMLQQLGIQVIRPAKEGTGLLRNGVTEADLSAAAQAWQAAERALTNGEWDVVILDELHAALRYNLVPQVAVVQAIAQRSGNIEVVTTGRNAPDTLRAIADYITEMHMEKHPFTQGIPARLGIEL